MAVKRSQTHRVLSPLILILAMITAKHSYSEIESDERVTHLNAIDNLTLTTAKLVLSRIEDLQRELTGNTQKTIYSVEEAQLDDATALIERRADEVGANEDVPGYNPNDAATLKNALDELKAAQDEFRQADLQQIDTALAIIESPNIKEVAVTDTPLAVADETSLATVQPTDIEALLPRQKELRIALRELKHLSELAKMVIDGHELMQGEEWVSRAFWEQRKILAILAGGAGIYSAATTFAWLASIGQPSLATVFAGVFGTVSFAALNQFYRDLRRHKLIFPADKIPTLNADLYRDKTKKRFVSLDTVKKHFLDLLVDRTGVATDELTLIENLTRLMDPKSSDHPTIGRECHPIELSDITRELLTDRINRASDINTLPTLAKFAAAEFNHESSTDEHTGLASFEAPPRPPTERYSNYDDAREQFRKMGALRIYHHLLKKNATRPVKK